MPSITHINVKYTLADSQAGKVSVLGRLSRSNSSGLLLPVPWDIKDRIASVIDGGATSPAILGLIVYALDQLEANKQRLSVKVS